jgi:hypothetical protein
MKNIKDFKEDDIRNAILQKASLGKINKQGKHWKGYIIIEGILVGKVKIPNAHPRIMHSSKSQYIANDLKLNEEQFNSFVECSLKSTSYYEIMKTFI